MASARSPAGGNGGGISTLARKWGHGSNILASAHQRRFRLENQTDGWDEDFGCANNDEESIVEADDDDDDPFASIDKFLDEQEKDFDCVPPDVKSPQNENSTFEHYCSESNLRNDCTTKKGHPKPESPTENLWDFSHQFEGGELSPKPISMAQQDKYPRRDGNPRLSNRQSFSELSGTTSPKTSQSATNNVVTQSTSRKRRQQSVMKTTTPRFTFSQKRNNAYATPSNKSLPSKVLFASAASSQKRRKWHTFRQSSESSTADAAQPAKQDARNVDFAPSFISRSGKSATAGGILKEEIHQDYAEDRNLVTANKMLRDGERHANNSLRRSKKESSSSSGYLTSHLHSLRSNDIRMSMRLRSGQYSSNLTMPALISRTRRLGGTGSSSNPRSDATTILDVTVSGNDHPGGGSMLFNEEGKATFLAYVHNYTIPRIGEEHFAKIQCPCFAWIILSQDVLREQGIANGCLKKLRFYDGIIVPSRGISPEQANVLLPTIICAHICEQYPNELPPLPDISFDAVH